MVARGEVWWSECPDWARRPVLVLTRDEVAPRLHHVLVALITHTVRDIPTEVALGTSDGMPRACVVNLDNLVTGRSRCSPNGSPGSGPMHQVCRALVHATGC